MPGPVAKGAVVGVPTLGAGGVGITYKVTQETVAGKLSEKGITIVEKDDNAWEKILVAFKGKEESVFKLQEFKDFHKKAKNESATPKVEKGSLSEFCLSKVDLTHKTLFSSNEELVEDVINACTTTIKDIVGTGNYEIEESKLDHDLLKNYSDSTDKLDSSLQEAKENLNNGENGKVTDANNKHAEWCKKASEYKYSGATETNYKVFITICKKKAGS